MELKKLLSSRFRYLLSKTHLFVGSPILYKLQVDVNFGDLRFAAIARRFSQRYGSHESRGTRKFDAEKPDRQKENARVDVRALSKMLGVDGYPNSRTGLPIFDGENVGAFGSGDSDGASHGGGGAD